VSRSPNSTHAFLRNLRAGFYYLGDTTAVAELRHGPRLACAWDALTATLLA
jgi:hypothetical protein